MEDLVRSYNPNYQDMAVRAAAVGYMELFHGGATPPAEGSGTGAAAGGKQPSDEKAEKEAETEYNVEEETEEEINDKELDELDKTDLMGLLVGWEDGTEDSAKTFAEDAESMSKSRCFKEADGHSLILVFSLQHRAVHPRPSPGVVRLSPAGTALLARQAAHRRPFNKAHACRGQLGSSDFQH